MNTATNAKTWEKTRLQNLVRHKSGRYYARLYLNGKEIWKSLKTATFSVAEAKLGALLKEHRGRKSQNIAPDEAKMTFGQAAAFHLQRIDEDVSLKKRTRSYWKETHIALNKSWPKLAALEIRRITPAQCREWASDYAEVACASRYNNTLSFLSHVFKVAIEEGVIYSSPSIGLKRKPVRPKALELPSRAKFTEFIKEMRSVHARESKNCADFAQGLAFTGCRKGEAALVEWRDVDFEASEILVKGDPEENTKNGDVRRVPMFPESKAFFQKLRADRADEPNTTKVFRVKECQQAMNRAATKIGMTRITHHDLRHLFATICIESGVDIPTVSRWLGHKDGGVLAMQTYGHLRREHSAAQALKVSFATLAA